MTSQLMTTLDTDGDNVVERREFMLAVGTGLLDSLILVEEEEIQLGDHLDLTENSSLTAAERERIKTRLAERRLPERTAETSDISGSF